MPLPQKQYDILRISNSVVNSISIAGSLFVIGVYIFGSSLRNYPLKLVCYMAISNALLSAAYISSIEEVLEGRLCTLQVIIKVSIGFYDQLSTTIVTNLDNDFFILPSKEHSIT
jgi:hypothetical protein